MNLPTHSSPVKPTFKWVFQTAGRTIAFGFGSGLSPMAPGTAGTLWAWAAFLLGEYFLSTEDFLWIIAGGFLLGCWVCGHVSEELGKKDFGGIVWDEIIAFWLVLIFIMPTNIWMQAGAFVIFRFFDAVKPGPIGMIDRHFKNLEGDHLPSSIFQILWRGFGIMVDDLAAAFFTLLIMALVQVFVR
ncbi:phosphatidylglycerophosphatase A [Polynucleobacter sp. AP-Latsch-80-C2]|jgi:phosphatidylglycerophosphatase A|uniref:phosphatidylglycerophosphatase A family protein n=1 Tax=Polynucleobacter sp. AP-Latsch-80-C2 TaxID=2576931 RepID=UPI001C0DD603|nr:phosphatidylglycerophosphatase A [Polynucleobacter sp. AP-Latsch-80-C2]MBU3623300.1 phosphatidylglycerophosphatase A [Polynucleobacter sp. AP-Latsch-80-C2]